VAERSERLYQVAGATGQWARFAILGLFVTAKTEPNDVDIVLLMQNSFDLTAVAGEAALVFEHMEGALALVTYWNESPAFKGSKSWLSCALIFHAPPNTFPSTAGWQALDKCGSPGWDESFFLKRLVPTRIT